MNLYASCFFFCWPIFRLYPSHIVNNPFCVCVVRAQFSLFILRLAEQKMPSLLNQIHFEIYQQST